MELLARLKLSVTNSGVSTGAHWWSSQNTQLIHSINPTNGKEIASVYEATDEDYEQVIKEAERAFLTWRHVPAPKRGELVRHLGDALRKNKDYLGSLVSLEMGKSKQEGDGEVQEMIDMADLAMGQSRMLYGLTMQSERAQHRMYEHWQPLGVIAVISAFNFPVAVWSWNAFLAVICGNTVVWKPSPKTSLCAVAVQHICNEVCEKLGYRGIFNLINSSQKEMVERLADDTRIPLLSFTGSTKVGKAINTRVAQRLGKVLLELSGNNAIIVDETADLQLAVPSIVFGAVGTAGQRCTTTRRLFLHQSIYQPVVSALTKAYQSIRIGDPLDQQNLMGPLIDEAAVEAYLTTISAIKTQGGNILFGGKRLMRDGFFVEPTLVEAKNEWDVVQRETFAPILYLMTYEKIEDAIAAQNYSQFGLSSALFTNNIRHSELFLSSAGSDCGIANINLGTSGAEIGGAFGGEKDTGGGREAGSDAWKHYMRRQTTTINWGAALTLAQGIQFQIG